MTKIHLNLGMQTELGLTQKGKVKVKGLFEDEEGSATLPTPPGE